MTTTTTTTDFVRHWRPNTAVDDYNDNELCQALAAQHSDRSMIDEMSDDLMFVKSKTTKVPIPT